jgi:hypothetical protein
VADPVRAALAFGLGCAIILISSTSLVGEYRRVALCEDHPEALPPEVQATGRAASCIGTRGWTRRRARRARPTYAASGLVRAVAGGALVGLLSMGSAAETALAAPAGWSVVLSPQVGGTRTGTGLESVSCPSASFCMAAGFYSTSSGQWPAFERWDGQRWSVVHSPEAAADDENQVLGMSCASTSSCVAVGSTPANRLLALVWDGTTWSTVPVPGGQGELNAVDCLPTDTCIAVGSRGPIASRAIALTERWDGGRWTVVPAAAGGASSNLSLDALYCTSAMWCIGVGNDGAGARSELWNGTKWSLGPVVPGPVAYQLSVSCASEQACLVVGEASPIPGPDLASWDGAHWSSVASAYKNPPHDTAGLSGVSCYSTHECVAVGFKGEVPNGSGCCRTPLIESWDGFKTTVVAQPTNFHALAGLSGVSCPPEGPCVAVGWTGEGGTDARSLVEMS